MKIKKSKRFISGLIILMLLVTSAADAFVGYTNFFAADDPAMSFKHVRNGKRTIGARFESGTRGGGKNVVGERRPLLSLYNDSESVKKMIRNPVGKALTEGANNLFVQTAYSGPFTDDGVRGHVSMTAKLQQT